VSLWSALLGQPFVYDKIRPLVVGGIDMRPLYERLTPSARKVVLDVGCGTGDALRYLDGFDQYVGIDTDPVAIQAAKRRWNGKGVTFEARHLEENDVLRLAPTGVVLSGVLHHLSNDEADGLLRLVARSPRLEQVVTSDIVFVPGMFFNNVLAMLDRGRHCRAPDAYASLARGAGLTLDSFRYQPASGDASRVVYWVMTLEREA
jgi:SAM-dependent methyltransferase